MITLKSAREIEGMNKAGKVLAKIFEEIEPMMVPGVITMDINDYFDRRIREEGGIPEELGFEGYEYSVCTSTNDAIAHGLPRKNEVLKDGDICSVDSVLSIDGYMADACYTYGIGSVADDVKHLMDVTKRCTYLGIEQARVGNRIGDIGHAIQEYAESEGFSVIRDFVGHGIQPTMHEDPSVPHYGKAGRGLRLKEGMTICIEPMIAMGDYHMYIDDDGWTGRTVDGSWCAQYEHTLTITKDGPRILTMQHLREDEKELGIDQYDIDYNLPED